MYIPSLKAKNFAKSFEKCRLIAYWDPNGQVWTIGWGHTPANESWVWTQAQCDHQFEIDAMDKAVGANHLLKVEVTQAQFDCLWDFAFNAGLESLESSTMLKAINAKRNVNQMLKLWLPEWDHNNQKQIVPGLLRRRDAELVQLAGIPMS